ncbi:hypothetical protein RND61_15715 [Streptomyces sp. TRM76323]|uniref:TetR family transcriptional regulator n=1 Tax=Streptomyces tamarix TaxID=3078565 RepID=A0ABU3QL60_9ACTN|nr:hypothetical protein [Streptomyces tamarix]MDT9683496.1 hypothetical protein [Streptomyces tamarix]
MKDPVTTHTFLGEMLDALPEMRGTVERKVRSAIALELDPADVTTVRTDVYALLRDLFDEVLLPALRAEPGPGRTEELRRCFAFLERVAASPEPVHPDFLEGLIGEYLIGAEGPASYAHAGPRVRAAMVRACGDWGMPVPTEWTDAPPVR